MKDVDFSGGKSSIVTISKINKQGYAIKRNVAVPKSKIRARKEKYAQYKN